jgi:hypothetical protein
MTTTPQRVTIRIVPRLIQRLEGYASDCVIDYMGARFAIPSRCILEPRDDNTVLVELGVVPIRKTGLASWLMDYKGNELRVHKQFIVEKETAR